MDEIPASEFDSKTFDAKEVVQRYRKRIPLPQLQKSLRAHHAATRQELVELINEKYADFVSLSSRMQGVERALRPLRAPLEESSELTRSLHTKLGAILDQAKETQKELASVRARKDGLASYIENAKILERAKESAAQRWGNPQESDDVLREHVAHENVARDLRRIRLNLGGKLQSMTSAGQPKPPPPPAPASSQQQGAGSSSAAPAAEGNSSTDGGAEAASAECQALLQETAAFQQTFVARLQERLQGLVGAAKCCWEVPAAPVQDSAAADVDQAAVLGPGPPPRSDLLAIAHLCRALVTVGRAAVVEATFAEIFVKSTLQAATSACTAAAEDARRQVLTAGDSAGSGGSAVLGIGAGAVDLGPFFQAVQSTLLTEGAPLLWLAQRLRSGSSDSDGDVESALLSVPSLHLVANAIATPVLQHVQQVWPNVFMPAFPDVFAVNHSHAAKFIVAVEGFMTASERQTFLQSFALTDFRRRWKTQVYFSLRQKEAVQRLQAVAVKPDAAQGSARYTGGQGEFWLEVSAELLKVLGVMWSDRWYLEALYPKMVQLSLELFSRYGKLVCGLAEVTDTPGAGWDASSSPPAWAPSSPPARLARVAADVLQVCSTLEAGGAEASSAAEDSAEGLQGRLARLILKRLPKASSAAGTGSGKSPRELVCALLHEAVVVVRPVLGELETAILQQVTAVTTPQFAAIRGIPALYRMLNKPVPTKPSPYVESSMRPVLALREATRGIAPADTVAGWVRGALEAAAAEFSVQATQLLESTRQQEASLRRLSGRGAGGEAQVSDLDKIHIQLCLDAESFATAAEGLGAVAEGDNGLAKLAAAVAPVRQTYEAHRVAPADS